MRKNVKKGNLSKKNNDLKYIQVCVNLSNKETLEREFSKFDEIDDNYDKLIISNDKEELSKNGIKHLNIIDFLLREDI